MKIRVPCYLLRGEDDGVGVIADEALYSCSKHFLDWIERKEETRTIYFNYGWKRVMLGINSAYSEPVPHDKTVLITRTVTCWILA